VLVLVLGVFASGLVIAFLAKPDLFGDPERRAISRTRAANLARASINQTLPGTPDLTNLPGRLAALNLTQGAPVLIRIFKREFQLELWMARDGRFERFATYPICRWSGWLGPKVSTGDRQAPEGFYTVANDQMNPSSRWHRSFNLGFPNAFDQQHGRTGSALMVHGGCSSAGCYAGKQKRFQVQVYPFRMSEENLAPLSDSPHIDFWRQLKQGSDLFDQTSVPPVVTACRNSYRFSPGTSAETAAALTVDCATPRLSERVRAKKAL
jgi:murein L,D-transpeptidase YafK